MSERERPEQDNPHVRLVTELERFSFGIATSPFARVTQVDGPDDFCTTLVAFDDVIIEHSHHPASGEQRIIIGGNWLPETIDDQNFMFDEQASLVMCWVPGMAGPMPVDDDAVADLAGTIKAVNDSFDAQA